MATRVVTEVDVADALLYARFVARATESEIAWAARVARERGETVQQLVARVWREGGAEYVARLDARAAALAALQDAVTALAEEALRRPRRMAGRRAA